MFPSSSVDYLTEKVGFILIALMWTKNIQDNENTFEEKRFALDFTLLSKKWTKMIGSWSFLLSQLTSQQVLTPALQMIDQ